MQMRDHSRTIRGGNNLGWLNEDRSHTHETLTVDIVTMCPDIMGSVRTDHTGVLTLWVVLGRTTRDMTLWTV